MTAFSNMLQFNAPFTSSAFSARCSSTRSTRYCSPSFKTSLISTAIWFPFLFTLHLQKERPCCVTGHQGQTSRAIVTNCPFLLAGSKVTSHVFGLLYIFHVFLTKRHQPEKGSFLPIHHFPTQTRQERARLHQNANSDAAKLACQSSSWFQNQPKYHPDLSKIKKLS